MLTEAGRLSAPWMGLVYLFRTLLPERRIEREEEREAEIKREKLLASRSVAGTQREIWGERGREREAQRERGQVVKVGQRPEMLVGTGNG